MAHKASAAALAQGRTRTLPVQGADLAAAYATLDCANATSRTSTAPTNPQEPMVTCAADGLTKYLLGPRQISNADIAHADAEDDTAASDGWLVDLHFTHAGSAAFAAETGALNNAPSPRDQFAILVDGLVLSSPIVTLGAITTGDAQISGDFTRSSAGQLAAALNRH